MTATETVRRSIFAALSCVVLAACVSEDDASEKPRASEDGNPLYAVFTVVTTGDDESTYLGLTDTLVGPVKLDTKNALERPGESRFYAPEGGGFFAIGSNEDYSITRYSVGADRKISEDGRVSFAHLGVKRLYYRAVFLSRTKAYYVDNSQGQIVLWNPKQMTVDGKISLPEQAVDGYEGYTVIFPYFQYPVVGNRLFIPVAWYNYDTGVARDVTGLIVVDTETDSVVSYTETARCAAAVELAFDDNGDVYYGTHVNYPFYANANDPEARKAQRAGCILRIRAGEEQFDPDYLLNIADVTDGRVGMSLANAAEPGFGYIQVLDDETPWESLEDEDTFWESQSWQWWQVDLRNQKAKRDDALPLGSPFIKTFDVDGKRYVVRQESDNMRSNVYLLDASGKHTAGIGAPGQIQGIARVR